MSAHGAKFSALVVHKSITLRGVSKEEEKYLRTCLHREKQKYNDMMVPLLGEAERVTAAILFTRNPDNGDLVITLAPRSKKTWEVISHG